MKKENFESLENVNIYTHADSLTEKVKILIKYRNVIKQNKGITMVALVITIIIMIILVGISVNLTIGNNGLITKAKQAKKNIEEATLNEQAAMNELYDEMMIATGSTSDNISTDGIPDKIIEYIDAKLNSKMLDIYPVGSIYMSTESTNPSELFGGTWESYGEGKTIVGEGSGYEAGTTGGNSTATLATENLPGHNHTVTASGSVSSTFKGSQVTTGNQSANHTHSFSGSTSYGYASGTNYGYNGGTSGKISSPWDIIVGTNGEGAVSSYSKGTYYRPGLDHYHTFSGNTGTNSANHNHTVTASGTVTSTFSGKQTTTSTTGSGTSFSVQDPYIVTYMWKRIE